MAEALTGCGDAGRQSLLLMGRSCGRTPEARETPWHLTKNPSPAWLRRPSSRARSLSLRPRARKKPISADAGQLPGTYPPTARTVLADVIDSSLVEPWRRGGRRSGTLRQQQAGTAWPWLNHPSSALRPIGRRPTHYGGPGEALDGRRVSVLKPNRSRASISGNALASSAVNSRRP